MVHTRTGPWSSDDDIAPTTELPPKREARTLDARSARSGPTSQVARSAFGAKASPLPAARAPERAVDPATAARLESIRRLAHPTHATPRRAAPPPPPPPRTRHHSDVRETMPAVQPSAAESAPEAHDVVAAEPAPEVQPVAHHASPRLALGGDASIAAVARQVAAPPARARSGALGWVVAAALLAIGGGLYLFGYAALERKLETVERERTEQLNAHDAALAKMSADLERARRELAHRVAAEQAVRSGAPSVAADSSTAKSRAPRELAPAKADAEREPSSVNEEAAREARRAEWREKIAEKRAAREAQSADHGGVDLAAAAAATAALEAQARESHSAQPSGGDVATPQPSAAEAPAEPKRSSGVSESDDPLEGL